MADKGESIRDDEEESTRVDKEESTTKKPIAWSRRIIMFDLPYWKDEYDDPTYMKGKVLAGVSSCGVIATPNIRSLTMTHFLMTRLKKVFRKIHVRLATELVKKFSGKDELLGPVEEPGEDAIYTNQSLDMDVLYRASETQQDYELCNHNMSEAFAFLGLAYMIQLAYVNLLNSKDEKNTNT
ncbi:hypothetical protein GIB67_002890 [Kingdonia uniflora]|uniref:Uncharacterized protein n=1 Tax=Kingdonia uniflora TaxID=39325 RepID=A0A7J7NQN9_9MAGN|nr:hypothetical protein GIB67_002890 [Kingdonia uniflora]